MVDEKIDTAITKSAREKAMKNSGLHSDNATLARTLLVAARRIDVEVIFAVPTFRPPRPLWATHPAPARCAGIVLQRDERILFSSSDLIRTLAMMGIKAYSQAARRRAPIVRKHGELRSSRGDLACTAIRF